MSLTFLSCVFCSPAFLLGLLPNPLSFQHLLLLLLLPQPLSNSPTCFWSLIARLLPVNGDTKSSQMLRVDLESAAVMLESPCDAIDGGFWWAVRYRGLVVGRCLMFCMIRLNNFCV